MSEDDELDYFDRIREQLRYWPYTVNQIDDTLDIGLIEGRGKQLLYRAIHSKNLIAFAGSGLSMSYGRLSWRDWETEQNRVVKRNAERFANIAEAAIEWIDRLDELLDPKKNLPLPKASKQIRKTIFSDDDDEKLAQPDRHNARQWLRTRRRSIQYAHRQIDRLQKTFELTQEKGGHFPGGEELPVKFEIAQQLHNQLRRFTDLFLPELTNEADPLDRTWPGTLISENSAAPESALKKFKSKIENRKLP